MVSATPSSYRRAMGGNGHRGSIAIALMMWACTGGGSTGQDPSSRDGGAPPSSSDTGGATPGSPAPRVIVRAEYANGNDTSCSASGAVLQLGEFARDGAASRPLESDDQNTLLLSCTVRRDNAGFVVHGMVDASGGQFEIDGTIAASGESSNVGALFVVPSTATVYEAKDCVVRYTTPAMGIAPGRIWGEITCSKALSTDKQHACQIVAEFRFENCAQ